MLTLTPSERRGAWVVVLVLATGTGWDLVRLRAPRTSLPAPVVEQARVRALDGVDSATIARDRAPAGAGIRHAVPPERATPTAPIDLNRATAADLDRLPGIGPVLAGRIVEHRSRHGWFRSIDELLAVPGIGPSLVARVREHVSIVSAPP